MDSGPKTRSVGTATSLTRVFVAACGVVVVFAFCFMTAAYAIYQIWSGVPIAKEIDENVWVFVQGRFPESSLTVCEEKLLQQTKRTERITVSGVAVSDATVVLKTPVNVIYNVPLDARWTFRQEENGHVHVIAPAPQVRAVEPQTDKIEVIFEDKALSEWIIDSKRMEQILREDITPASRRRAAARIASDDDLREKAKQGVRAFVEEFVLEQMLKTKATSVSVEFR